MSIQIQSRFTFDLITNQPDTRMNNVYSDIAYEWVTNCKF
ncbi:hypothetical protein NARC_30219 [Candidatus Nitrosocosmicus arcticus]|uniref:Uncharacterized protein n=1 Tax=Candidatus Nitrosocosmicus arcticus TaxID=2035267 RepID=A0A557SY15_9ARCH|nr:hypothetical protein NARC_30219 [Candidatus Nitrosocosmicus arcticus]